MFVFVCLCLFRPSHDSCIPSWIVAKPLKDWWRGPPFFLTYSMVVGQSTGRKKTWVWNPSGWGHWTWAMPLLEGNLKPHQGYLFQSGSSFRGQTHWVQSRLGLIYWPRPFIWALVVQCFTACSSCTPLAWLLLLGISCISGSWLLALPSSWMWVLIVQDFDLYSLVLGNSNR